MPLLGSPSPPPSVDLPPCWIKSAPATCPHPRVDIPLRNQLYSALRRLPPTEHALVVDIGANDGLFSLNTMHLAEQVPPQGIGPLSASRRAKQPADSLARRISLILIEPQATMARSLQRLVTRYTGSAYWPVAAWTHDANLTFRGDRHKVRSSLLDARDSGRSTREVYTVPAIDVASRLHQELDRRRPSLLLLKLDVEGAEYELVPHLLMNGLLCRAHYLLFEWHLNSLPQRSRLSGLALRHSIARMLEHCPTPPRTVAHEEFPDENLGLPVDGLARLALEHNGTAPLGVSKKWTKHLEAVGSARSPDSDFSVGA